MDFDPQAEPTNPVALGYPKPKPKDKEAPIPTDLQFRMSLHRDLLRGTGFWPTLKSKAKEEDEKITAETMGKASSQVPNHNFLDIADQKLVDVLMLEALPADRARLRQYLSNRWLGLSLITAVSSYKHFDQLWFS